MQPSSSNRTTQTGLSIGDAARRLGVGRTTLYNLIKINAIKVVHIGSRTIVPSEQVDSLLAGEAQQNLASHSVDCSDVIVIDTLA